MTDGGAPVVPERTAAVVWASVDDEIVAVDATGRAHVITSTGALLWPLLDGSTPAGELAADVADVFGIEVDVALADVHRFIDEMVSLGLVVAPHEHQDLP